MSELSWSLEQHAIFNWFQSGSGHLVVQARAGTGKTTTIKHAFSFAPESEILYSVFNKKNQVEAQAKISDPRVSIKTLHSLGFSYVSSMWPGSRPEQLVERDRVCGDSDLPGEVVTQACRLVGFAKNLFIGVPTHEELVEIALEREIDAGEEFELPENGGFSVQKLAQLARAALNRSLARDPQGRISFDDMIWLAPSLGWVKARYDLVVVDEAQDLNRPQLAIARGACKRGGRICIVGDDRQCHPAGTLIELAGGGQLRIEDVRTGDELVSYHDCFRGIRTQGRKVLGTGKRQFSGNLFSVKADRFSCDMTSNHRVPTRLDGADGYAVYLMEHAGISRIGYCQIRYEGGPAMRARQEGAEKLWVLDVFANRSDARIAETVFALKFNLPERAGLNNKPDEKAAILAAIGTNYRNATNCLNFFGREYDYPLWTPETGEHIGKRLYVTEACNLINGRNLIRTFEGSRDGGNWSPVTIDRKWVEDLTVYSLSVEPTEGGLRLYVANRLLVHNCIYGFRGADSAGMARMQTELSASVLGLSTTYRCPKAVVKLAAEIVPDYNAAPSAPEGIVDEVDYDDLLTHVEIGDVILSRLNAPLLPLCLALLRSGVAARIEGRDVGAMLRAIVKKFNAKSVPDFLRKVATWEAKKIARLAAAKKSFSHITDQAETLVAIAEGCANVREIDTRLISLFADTEPGGRPCVVLSTVHKAKGLEFDHVFLLAQTFRKFKGEQESNIFYVALTRAKNRLTFVE